MVLPNITNELSFQYTLMKTNAIGNNPSWFSISGKTMTFDPEPSNKEMLYYCYVSFDFMASDYVGSYFGHPSSKDIGTFNDYYVQQVKVMPLKSGIKLSLSSQDPDARLLTFKFSEEVDITEDFTDKRVFKEIFNITKIQSSKYTFKEHGLEYDFVSLSSTELKIRLDNTDIGYKGGEILYFEFAQGNQTDTTPLIISKNPKNMRFMDTHSVKVTMKEGYITCDEVKSLPSSTHNIMLFQKYDYELDFFKAAAGGACENKDYTLALSSKTSKGEKADTSYQQFTKLDSD